MPKTDLVFYDAGIKKGQEQFRQLLKEAVEKLSYLVKMRNLDAIEQAKTFLSHPKIQKLTEE